MLLEPSLMWVQSYPYRFCFSQTYFRCVRNEKVGGVNYPSRWGSLLATRVASARLGSREASYTQEVATTDCRVDTAVLGDSSSQSVSIGTSTAECTSTGLHIYILSSCRCMAVLPSLTRETLCGSETCNLVDVVSVGLCKVLSTFGASLRSLIKAPETGNTKEQSTAAETGSQTNTGSSHTTATFVITIATITVAIAVTPAILDECEVPRS